MCLRIGLCGFASLDDAQRVDGTCCRVQVRNALRQAFLDADCMFKEYVHGRMQFPHSRNGKRFRWRTTGTCGLVTVVKGRPSSRVCTPPSPLRA